jgi:hypothetical protein
MSALMLRRFAASLVALVLCSSAQAQLFRAYLASDGNDANPCTLAAPCRLLPAALAAVADKGEIWMLDSANYNTATVTIGKSVSILAVPGAVGSIVATGGPAVAVSASNLTIALRNVVIVPLYSGGVTTGTRGIYLTGASSVSIEDSSIANVPEDAIFVMGSGRVKVAHTVLRDNVNFGLQARDGAACEVTSSRIVVPFGSSGGGILAASGTATTTTVTVSDSVISGADTGGSGEGVYALSYAVNAVTRIAFVRSTVEGLGVGVDAETNGNGSAVVSLSGSAVTNNYYGWYQQAAGSVIRGFGNNLVSDNVTSVGAITSTSPM